MTIKTARIRAQTIIKTPPLNRTMSPIFFGSFRLVCQSIGIGIERRYKSESIFKLA